MSPNSAPADLRDHLLLHLAVLLWGFSSVFGVLIELPSLEVVLYRCLLAALALGVLLGLRSLPFATSRYHLRIMALTGVLIALHWIFFFASAKVANISVCLVGFSTTSFWTSLFEPFIQRRPFSWADWFSGLLVVAGAALLFSLPGIPVLGFSLGLLCAVFSGLAGSINPLLVKEEKPRKIAFYQMSIAFLVMSLFMGGRWAFAGQPIGLPSPSDWGYLFLLSWLCTVMAYVIAISLLRKFSAFAIALTLNLEPLYGIGLGFLIFGSEEKMSAGFYLGGGIILLSVFGKNLFRKAGRRLFNPFLGKR